MQNPPTRFSENSRGGKLPHRRMRKEGRKEESSWENLLDSNFPVDPLWEFAIVPSLENVFYILLLPTPTSLPH